MLYLVRLSSPRIVSSAIALQSVKRARRAWRTWLSIGLRSRIACILSRSARDGAWTPTGPVGKPARIIAATQKTLFRWAEARIKIARMTLTIKLDGNWNSFQLANNTPPLSVTGSVIAPSARMTVYKSYSTSGAVRTCGIISRVSHHLGSGGLRHLLQMYVNISAARQSADI